MSNDANQFRLAGSRLIASEKEDSLQHNTGEYSIQLWSLLTAGRLTIALVTVSALVIGLAYLALVPPTYQADGLIQIEENPGKGGSSAELKDLSSLLLGVPVQTRGELQILKSRLVLNEVVEKLSLLVQAKPVFFPVIGAAIARNRFSSAPVSVPRFLRSYAWGGERISVPTFEVPDELLGKKFTLSKTPQGFTVTLPDGVKLLDGRVGEAATVATAEGKFSIFVQQLDALPGTRFRLIRRSEQEALRDLFEHLYVGELGKQSSVIAVSFQGGSADLVTNVVNALEDAYLRQNVERRSANAQQSLDFLERQLPELRAQVDRAQAEMNAYQSARGSVNVGEETLQAIKKTSELDTDRLQLLERRDELLGRFTRQHPTVQAIDEQIAALDSAKEKIEGAVRRLPTTQQAIFSLSRNLEVRNALYAQMLNSIQTLEVAKAGTIGNVRLVDRALRPYKPSKPHAAEVLLYSLLAGLFSGALAVLAKRAFLRGIDDPSIVESRLGLSTYGMIPFSSAQARVARDLERGDAGSHVLATSHPEDLAVEAVRSLRTALQFALMEVESNIIMLTGPAPNLGKSFVSINLAAVLASSEKSVVVLDADLRRGHLHRYLSMPASPGISDFVAGTSDASAIVQRSALPGLSIVSRGTAAPNPAELLMHYRFAELVKALSSKFDFVLIDTAPILAVTDAAIVGRLAGCTLLLLKSAEHRFREIEDSVRRLRIAGVKIKGIVFNQVGAKAGSYGYKNYGQTAYRYTAEP